jgi:hypothetical protein
MWVPGVSDSMARALGTSCTYEVKSTVNPLIYTVVFTFGEKQPGKQMLLLWNVVQQYAAKNDAVPKGKVYSNDGTKLAVDVILKRRLGPPRNEAP